MRMINELTNIVAELSHYSICEDSDYIKSMENKLRKTKKGTELSFNHWKQGLTKGTFQGLGTLGGKPFAKISTKTRSHWVPIHHVNEEKEDVNESSLYKRGDKIELGKNTQWHGYYDILDVKKNFKNGKHQVIVNFKGKKKTFHLD